MESVNQELIVHTNKHRKTVGLSINGGGIRGYITALVVA